VSPRRREVVHRDDGTPITVTKPPRADVLHYPAHDLTTVLVRRTHDRTVARALAEARWAELLAAKLVDQPLGAEDHRVSRGRVLAGHRRLAAARMAGLRRVPCLLVEPRTDDEAIVEMFTENRHRVGLTPAEKTSAARALRHEFGWPVSRIAQRLGVHPQTVTRWLGGRNDDEAKLATSPAASARAKAGAATRARNTSATLRGPSTVSVRRVHDVVTRWDGRAPADLLDELRELTGGWTPR
jgi:transcriptional regulator with XRE-family HTH domain